MKELVELVAVFRAESEETLDRLEELLLRLEQTPHDGELLHEIFRGAHTIRGGAGFLRFDELAVLASEMEETLEPLLNGTGRADAACIAHLLELVDGMRGFTGNAFAHHAGSLRVEVDKLDWMLDLAGAIATAHGHVRELASGDARLLDAMRELDRLALDLQEVVARSRMVALAPALRPFQRVVRDVAAVRRKRVSLVLEANGVQADVAVVEQFRASLAPALLHMIDHAIGSEGTIRITASRDEDGITVRVAAGGDGLDSSVMTFHL